MSGQPTASPRPWAEGEWLRHVAAARSALIKRDVIARSLARGQPSGGTAEGAEARREWAAWGAKARAHLHRLEALSPAAPEGTRAPAMADRLRAWLRETAP